MLLSEEFAAGRVTSREFADRNREIELARRVREEQARRRTADAEAPVETKAARRSAQAGVVAGAESLLRARAEHPAGTARLDAEHVEAATQEERELQSAAC